MNRKREQPDEEEVGYSPDGYTSSSGSSSDGSLCESPVGASSSTLRREIEQQPGIKETELPSRIDRHSRGGFANSFNIAARKPAATGFPRPVATNDTFAQRNQLLLGEPRLQQRERPLGLDSMPGAQLSDQQGYRQRGMYIQQPQFGQSISAYPAATRQFGLSQYLESEMSVRPKSETARSNSLLDRQFALRNAPDADDILSSSSSNYKPYPLQHQLSGQAGSFEVDGPGRGLIRDDTLRSSRVGRLLAGYLPPHDRLLSSEQFPRTYAGASSLRNELHVDASLPNIPQPQDTMRRQRELLEALRDEQAMRSVHGVGTSAPLLLYHERQQQEARLQALLSEGRSLERQLAMAGNPVDYLHPPHVGHPDILDRKLTSILPSPIDREADYMSTNARGKRAIREQEPKLKRSKSTPPAQGVSAADDQPRYTLPPGKGLPLSLPSDQGILSEYQQLIRQSIEVFEAQPGDVLTGVQGRRKKIEPSQVGLRCRYCAQRPSHWRGRGSAYYPGTLACVYQAAQNMAANHFVKTCDDIPPDVHKKFVEARQRQEQETRRSGGKTYWREASRHVGLEEREGQSGVWFRSS